MSSGYDNLIDIIAGCIDFESKPDPTARSRTGYVKYDKVFDVVIKSSDGEKKSTNWTLYQNFNGKSIAKHNMTPYETPPFMNLSNFDVVRREVAKRLYGKNAQPKIIAQWKDIPLKVSRSGLYFGEPISNLRSGESSTQQPSTAYRAPEKPIASAVESKLTEALVEKGMNPSEVFSETAQVESDFDTSLIDDHKTPTEPESEPASEDRIVDAMKAVKNELSRIPAEPDMQGYSNVYGVAALKVLGKPSGIFDIVRTAELLGAVFKTGNVHNNLSKHLGRIAGVRNNNGAYWLEDYSMSIPEPTSARYKLKKKELDGEPAPVSKSRNPDTIPNPRSKSNDFASGASQVIMKGASVETKMLSAIEKLIKQNQELTGRVESLEGQVEALSESFESTKAENLKLKEQLASAEQSQGIKSSTLDAFLDL